MKHYELMYLVSAQLPENQLGPIQAEVNEWITTNEGTVTKHEAWGRKKLAYPINKERYGFYFLAEFDLEPAKLLDVQKKLRLHKQIYRSLIVTKKPLSEKELLLQEQAQKRAHARFAAQARTADERENETQKPSQSAKAPKTEPKITLEDLDKKLDELLDQDMLN